MIRKFVILSVLTGWVGWGQTTTVAQIVPGPDGNRAAGTVTLTLSNSCTTPGGTYVVQGSKTISFTNGVFSAALVPNDSCVPGGPGYQYLGSWNSNVTYTIGKAVTYNGYLYAAIGVSQGVPPGTNAGLWSSVTTSYKAVWSLTNYPALPATQTNWVETWVVPTSAVPVTIGNVKVAAPPLATIPLPGASGQGFAWRGIWVQTTPYNAYDVVEYSGADYVAIQPSTGVTPGVDGGITWQLFGVAVRDWSVDLAFPLTTDSGLWQHQISYSYAIIGISCSTDSGSLSLNFDVRVPSAPNVAGYNVLSVPLVCNGSSTSFGTPTSPVAVPAGSPVALDILGVTGSPQIVRIYVATN